MPIAYVATFLVGAVFVFSGVLKAIDARTFARDLARYRLIPPGSLVLVAQVATGLELALGVALILHVYPAVLIPLAMAVLAVLAGLTLWGEQTRDLEDCGCYGGVVLLTPKQSAALDAVYIAILALALAVPAAGHTTPVWAFGIVAAAFVVGVVLAWQSKDEPLVDLSRLQQGRRWKTRWLPERDLQQGQHFVVFLSQSCPYCKRWVPLMNIMNTQADLPDVVGIMGIEDAAMATFREEHLIHFPVLQMQPLLFKQMVDAYPTAVLVEDGVVAERWEGEIPEPYFSRIKQFYESIRVPPSTSAAKRFGG